MHKNYFLGKINIIKSHEYIYELDKEQKKGGVFKMKIIDKIALVLIIIGAIKWRLIGFFKFDIHAAIFEQMIVLSRIVYALLGIQ